MSEKVRKDDQSRIRPFGMSVMSKVAASWLGKTGKGRGIEVLAVKMQFDFVNSCIVIQNLLNLY